MWGLDFWGEGRGDFEVVSCDRPARTASLYIDVLANYYNLYYSVYILGVTHYRL